MAEDEDLVTEVTKSILERGGYKVLTAANGREALELYIEHRDIISLVMLDLIMPEMDGRKCLSKLLEVNPELKILVISGYYVNEISKQIIASGASGFICKPYGSKQILSAIREILDSD